MTVVFWVIAALAAFGLGIELLSLARIPLTPFLGEGAFATLLMQDHILPMLSLCVFGMFAASALGRMRRIARAIEVRSETEMVLAERIGQLRSAMNTLDAARDADRRRSA